MCISFDILFPDTIPLTQNYSDWEHTDTIQSKSQLASDTAVFNDFCWQDSDACFQSSSESDSDDAPLKPELSSELATWTCKSGCSREVINDLLSLLRKQGLKLPKDCRTLKKPQHLLMLMKNVVEHINILVLK